MANVISSFKDEKHKKKKLKYKGNIEIHEYEKNGINSFNKPSYIKADKLFYFNKQKIDYYVFGRISNDLLNELIKIIINLKQEDKVEAIIKNL